MSTTTTKAENKALSPAELQKNIECHKTTSAHLQEAAKHHLEAAKHHEKGEHEKAAQSTIVALGHVHIATESQKEDVKHHAVTK